MKRLLQILPLLLALFIFSSRLALANPAAINDRQGDGSNDNNDPIGSDSGGNGESNEDIVASNNEELLIDLRVSAYVAMITLCHVCSYVIEDFRKTFRSQEAETVDILNIMQDNLVRVYMPFCLFCKVY